MAKWTVSQVATGADVIAGTTSINSLVVVDLDGDGASDVVATFDRSGLSGLTNDALVWFRNTQPLDTSAAIATLLKARN